MDLKVTQLMNVMGTFGGVRHLGTAWEARAGHLRKLVGCASSRSREWDTFNLSQTACIVASRRGPRPFACLSVYLYAYAYRLLWAGRDGCSPLLQDLAQAYEYPNRRPGPSRVDISTTELVILLQ